MLSSANWNPWYNWCTWDHTSESNPLNSLEIPWNPLKLFKITWNYLKLLENAWNLLKSLQNPLKSLQNPLKSQSIQIDYKSLQFWYICLLVSEHTSNWNALKCLELPWNCLNSNENPEISWKQFNYLETLISNEWNSMKALMDLTWLQVKSFDFWDPMKYPEIPSNSLKYLKLPWIIWKPTKFLEISRKTIEILWITLISFYYLWLDWISLNFLDLPWNT